MTRSASGFRPALELALEQALKYLENLDETPVSARADLATLRQRMANPLAEEGIAAEQVVACLVRDTAGGHIGCAGGRFFGWVIGGSLPAALAADWLTSAWDENCTLFASAPATAVAEEVAGTWLKEILGLPEQASFAWPTPRVLPPRATECWRRAAGTWRSADFAAPRPFGFSPAISGTAPSNAVCACWGWDARAWSIYRWTTTGG
jgi:hypothetical protein